MPFLPPFFSSTATGSLWSLICRYSHTTQRSERCWIETRRLLTEGQNLREPTSSRRDRDIQKAQCPQEGTRCRIWASFASCKKRLRANSRLGIIHQARLSPDYVLLLPLQHDSGVDKGRIALTQREGTSEHARRGLVVAAGHLQLASTQESGRVLKDNKTLRLPQLLHGSRISNPKVG